MLDEDVEPTVLDAVGIEPPEEARHIPQSDMHGRSFAESFANPEAASPRRTQYYEMFAPGCDRASGTLRYGAEVLEGYEGESLVPVLADQVTARLPAEFGPAALFIDSEPYGDYYIVK